MSANAHSIKPRLASCSGAKLGLVSCSDGELSGLGAGLWSRAAPACAVPAQRQQVGFSLWLSDNCPMILNYASLWYGAVMDARFLLKVKGGRWQCAQVENCGHVLSSAPGTSQHKLLCGHRLSHLWNLRDPFRPSPLEGLSKGGYADFFSPLCPLLSSPQSLGRSREHRRGRGYFQAGKRVLRIKIKSNQKEGN